MRAVAKGIWTRAHEMRKEKNSDRHGHDETEQTEQSRLQHLRETAMWCDLRDSGALSLSEKEKQTFHPSTQEHRLKEETARLAGMWLRSCRPVLQHCKQEKEMIQEVPEDSSSSVSSSSSSSGSSSDAVGGTSGGSATDDESLMGLDRNQWISVAPARKAPPAECRISALMCCC